MIARRIPPSAHTRCWGRATDSCPGILILQPACAPGGSDRGIAFYSSAIPLTVLCAQGCCRGHNPVCPCEGHLGSGRAPLYCLPSEAGSHFRGTWLLLSPLQTVGWRCWLWAHLSCRDRANVRYDFALQLYFLTLSGQSWPLPHPLNKKPGSLWSFQNKVSMVLTLLPCLLSSMVI